MLTLLCILILRLEEGGRGKGEGREVILVLKFGYSLFFRINSRRERKEERRKSSHIWPVRELRWMLPRFKDHFIEICMFF